MAFWAAVRTVRNHDRLAAESVVSAGFEILTPKVRERVGSRWRTVPLFPGYFFVRVVDRWRVIERSMGVLTIVKVGVTPAKCPDAEIAALIERSDPDGVIRLAARPPLRPIRRAFTPGARVEIAGGPFRGVEGVYQGMSARERELVLLNVLGSQRPVEIAAGLLAPH